MALPYTVISKGSITTSEAQVTATDQMVEREVVLFAAAGNPSVIYVGPTGLTAGTDGIPLSAGDSFKIVSVEFSRVNLSELFVIADSGSTSKLYVYWR